MEWTYAITTPFAVPPTLHDVPLPALWISRATLYFNEGEIDRTLYDALVGDYPEHVARTPANPLVAAVYAARGRR